MGMTRRQHYEALAQLEPDHAKAHALLRQASACDVVDTQLGLANCSSKVSLGQQKAIYQALTMKVSYPLSLLPPH